MHRIVSSALAFLLSACTMSTAQLLPSKPVSSSAPESITVSEAFLNRQELAWNDKIEPGYYHSLLLGDGVAGCSILKDDADPKGLKWVLSRYDIAATSGLPGEMCTPRLFAGNILLVPTGNILKESMQQDLWNGQATGSFITDKGHVYWRSYVHRTLEAFIVEVKTMGDEKDAVLRVREVWGISPTVEHDKKHKKFDLEALKDKLPPQPETERVGEITVITQELKGKAGHAVAWTVYSPEPGKRILIATLGAKRVAAISQHSATEFARNEAVERLKEVRRLSLAQLDQSHQAWWHGYWQKSKLEIVEDPYWEKFWHQQVYKFATASAEDSAFVFDTQGPWNGVCGWGAIWWNLNVQLSYYPMYSANRLEEGKSLVNGMDRLFKSGVLNKNAGKLSGDSIWIGRSTDYMGSGTWGDEAGNLSWVMHCIWRYWQHTGDDSVATTQLFPMLKQDVNWYLHQLKMGEDGKLHMPPTRSPEYEDCVRSEGKPDLYPDCNYAMMSLYWGLQTLIDLNDQFKLKDPLRGRWEQTLKNLAPMPVGDNGFKIGATQEFHKSHRHYSHLLAIYPYHIVNPEQGPEAVKLIQKSVDHFTSMPQAHAGYSETGSCAMYAILGQGDTAISWLDRLKKRIEWNTLYREGGGQVVETPLSAVDSIGYLLLQSWGDKVRVFPAVPNRWQNVSYENFSAQGAFLVSARRQAGKTVSIAVKSLKGNPLKLHPGPGMTPGSYQIQAPAGVAVKVNDAGLIEATLPAGGELRLTAK